MGKLMLTMLAAFGEFVRELIRGRQREGIAIAKANGVYKGRKKALATEQLQELVEPASTADAARPSCAELRDRPGDCVPVPAQWGLRSLPDLPESPMSGPRASMRERPQRMEAV